MIAIHWFMAGLIMALTFVLGAIAGQWDSFRIVRRRERRRLDQASQFGPLETVTFGDGSYVVIASLPAPGHDSKGEKP